MMTLQVGGIHYTGAADRVSVRMIPPPHNFRMKRIMIPILSWAVAWLVMAGSLRADELEQIFERPPEAAKPRVLWMWMGRHVSRDGITRDLEALRDAGFGGTTLFSLSDMPTTWSADIGDSVKPEIVTWSEPWWKLVRHAAAESERLGMDFGMHNCAGYATSGGPWVTPEQSMQQVCWSETRVSGPQRITAAIARPQVDPRSVMLWPIFNSDLAKGEYPEIPGRREFYRDVAVLAMPATGTVAKGQVINLTQKLGADGKLDWEAPAGEWLIYRFGHTTMGAMQFPAQWHANGLECDKMNPEAVESHLKHVMGEIHKHLGGYVGSTFTHLHFDSYEEQQATWTPRMREEFAKRRGYDLTPFLPVLANRMIDGQAETERFKADMQRTIYDLYRDAYFGTTSRVLRQAGLTFMCEPYGGSWVMGEVAPLVERVTAEFWSDSGRFRSHATEATIAAARQAGRNIIDAEAFTSMPEHSKWTEYPAMLKAAGDVAFCEGINRFVVHRFTHQPWDPRYKPGYTMGQWGTHMDRTQTWWEPGKEMVRYWQRCQALLQWGGHVNQPEAFQAVAPAAADGAQPPLPLRWIQRSGGNAQVFFVANPDRAVGGTVVGSFAVGNKQPELWDPVTGTHRNLTDFKRVDGRTLVSLEFAPAQSWFVVFRNPHEAAAEGVAVRPAAANFATLVELAALAGPWTVAFDPAWGGPKQAVTFDKLEDWTKRPEPGVRYYSGTAVYQNVFDLPPNAEPHDRGPVFLDLGVVNHIARVKLNGRDLGVVWTAPWRVDVSRALMVKQNRLEIEVTNVWANRLIGDEHEPADCTWYPLPGEDNRWCHGVPLKELPAWFRSGQPRPSSGRFCFTTWNYFNKDSPLVSSGLLGPVRLIKPQ